MRVHGYWSGDIGKGLWFYRGVACEGGGVIQGSTTTHQV